jgi:phosphoenolpyruvate carboxylase
MHKDTHNLAKKYLVILEGENISDTYKSHASTKYTTDNMQRFIPIAQDQADEEINKLASEKIREKLKAGFSRLKSLVQACESKTCTYKQISALLHLMNDPEFTGDLETYKTSLQEENRESGLNSSLAS